MQVANASMHEHTRNWLTPHVIGRYGRAYGDGRKEGGLGLHWWVQEWRNFGQPYLVAKNKWDLIAKDNSRDMCSGVNAPWGVGVRMG